MVKDRLDYHQHLLPFNLPLQQPLSSWNLLLGLFLCILWTAILQLLGFTSPASPKC